MTDCAAGTCRMGWEGGARNHTIVSFAPHKWVGLKDFLDNILQSMRRCGVWPCSNLVKPKIICLVCSRGARFWGLSWKLGD